MVTSPGVSPASGNIFMVIAPSGAGKSSLVAALLKQDATIHLAISYTTRPPRPGEVHGREYYFTDVPQFKKMCEQDQLLEWAYVHDNYYGTPHANIAQATQQGQDILLEIDWQGARQVRERFPEAISIFILPPSIKALASRLKARGQDTDSVIAQRLLTAEKEIAHAPECEYVIINHEFKLALTELKRIVHASRLRFSSQAARHAHLFLQLGIAPH